MVCTFGDLTDVTWWRELGLPVRACSAPTGACSTSPGERRAGSAATSSGRARATASCAAARVNQARRRIVELLGESGDLVGEPEPVNARGEVLREGRAPGRDRHEPPVVHPHGRAPRGADRARPRAALASAVHARALRGLGERPQRRLVRQPPALLRRAVPGLVSDRRRAARCSTTSRSPRARSSCRSTPRPTFPTATRPPSAGSRAASWATPT